jgi:hypothetical protein
MIVLNLIILTVHVQIIAHIQEVAKTDSALVMKDFMEMIALNLMIQIAHPVQTIAHIQDLAIMEYAHVMKDLKDTIALMLQ